MRCGLATLPHVNDGDHADRRPPIRTVRFWIMALARRRCIKYLDKARQGIFVSQLCQLVYSLSYLGETMVAGGYAPEASSMAGMA